ncbi:MAG TPA: hypothetical protein PLQ04_04915, partial [Lachnospiraceae bacterium]|nr:hypothetical protein [Lachnospiraceae bacterium]
NPHEFIVAKAFSKVNRHAQDITFTILVIYHILCLGDNLHNLSQSLILCPFESNEGEIKREFSVEFS